MNYVKFLGLQYLNGHRAWPLPTASLADPPCLFFVVNLGKDIQCDFYIYKPTGDNLAVYNAKGKHFWIDVEGQDAAGVLVRDEKILIHTQGCVLKRNLLIGRKVLEIQL
jgi:hypothetical protein